MATRKLHNLVGCNVDASGLLGARIRTLNLGPLAEIEIINLEDSADVLYLGSRREWKPEVKCTYSMPHLQVQEEQNGWPVKLVDALSHKRRA